MNYRELAGLCTRYACVQYLKVEAKTPADRCLSMVQHRLGVKADRQCSVY